MATEKPHKPEAGMGKKLKERKAEEEAEEDTHQRSS